MQNLNRASVCGDMTVPFTSIFRDSLRKAGKLRHAKKTKNKTESDITSSPVCREVFSESIMWISMIQEVWTRSHHGLKAIMGLYTKILSGVPLIMTLIQTKYHKTNTIIRFVLSCQLGQMRRSSDQDWKLGVRGRKIRSGDGEMADHERKREQNGGEKCRKGIN